MSDPMMVPLMDEFPGVPAWIFYNIGEHSLACMKCRASEKIKSGPLVQGNQSGVDYFEARVLEFMEKHKHDNV